VTKFAFAFNDVGTSNVLFSTFEIHRLFQMPFCRMWIHGKMLVLRLKKQTASKIIMKRCRQVICGNDAAGP